VATMKVPIRMTEPDAERLMLLSRYVNSPMEGQHLIELERKISEADICAPEEIPPDIVTMNSRALVRYLDTGETAVFTVVFPSRTNAQHNRISVLGSFGRALLGAAVGDEIEYASGVGTRRCRVEGIIFQPEAAGDYLG
jgi:regulator of nucleoside diphosphate kinase